MSQGMGPYSFGSAAPGFTGFGNSSELFSQLLASLGQSGNGASGVGGGLPDSLQKAFDAMSENTGESKLGNTLGNLGAGADVLGGLAKIYLGFKANKLAAKDLNFQREAFNTNLEGTRSAYNSQVRDTAANRAHQYGTPDYAASYVKKNELPITRI